MNATMGWGLAAAAMAAGWYAYGWPGVALAVTVTVFWLLIQFNRAVRAMKRAGTAPMGRVDSAVMLHAKLRAGMALLEVLQLAGSLGEIVGDPAAEAFCWRDGSGRRLDARFSKGRLVSWQLSEPLAGDTRPPPP
jgi:hypothetical protein